MSKKHEALVKKAKEAINAVFEDNSVNPEKTSDSLTALRDEINQLQDTLDATQD